MTSPLSRGDIPNGRAGAPLEQGKRLLLALPLPPSDRGLKQPAAGKSSTPPLPPLDHGLAAAYSSLEGSRRFWKVLEGRGAACSSLQQPAAACSSHSSSPAETKRGAYKREIVILLFSHGNT